MWRFRDSREEIILTMFVLLTSSRIFTLTETDVYYGYSASSFDSSGFRSKNPSAYENSRRVSHHHRSQSNVTVARVSFRLRKEESREPRSPRTPGIRISCACRKGGQVANQAARERERDRGRHPETFITFGFKRAHCAVNGVPCVPPFLLSRSYVPRIHSILRRLPFRESAKRRSGERKRRMQ